jgi:uncharacterized protein (DUF1778 family)
MWWYTSSMKRDDVLNLRVPGDLKAALRKAAAQDERSMSILATRVLRQWLSANHFFEAEEPRSKRRGVGRKRW